MEYLTVMEEIQAERSNCFLISVYCIQRFSSIKSHDVHAHYAGRRSYVHGNMDLCCRIVFIQYTRMCALVSFVEYVVDIAP